MVVLLSWLNSAYMKSCDGTQHGLVVHLGAGRNEVLLGSRFCVHVLCACNRFVGSEVINEMSRGCGYRLLDIRQCRPFTE